MRAACGTGCGACLPPPGDPTIPPGLWEPGPRRWHRVRDSVINEWWPPCGTRTTVTVPERVLSHRRHCAQQG
ncbi:hypothetical protein APASM_1729 [Actinosynnema pretiosum subsp. pretiosum]|nr:hypothetical protein APASM_1729 [Actinosynnema pretiosum subsp. pretiosum]